MNSSLLTVHIYYIALIFTFLSHLLAIWVINQHLNIVFYNYNISLEFTVFRTGICTMFWAKSVFRQWTRQTMVHLHPHSDLALTASTKSGSLTREYNGINHNSFFVQELFFGVFWICSERRPKELVTTCTILHAEIFIVLHCLLQIFENDIILSHSLNTHMDKHWNTNISEWKQVLYTSSHIRRHFKMFSHFSSRGGQRSSVCSFLSTCSLFVKRKWDKSSDILLGTFFRRF